MSSMELQEVAELNAKSRPEATEAERKELLEDAILKREPLAESALEMAKMFIAKGQPEVALRRLRKILIEFEQSAAAQQAQVLLDQLEHRSGSA